MKELVEIACFDKQNAYKGGVEVVGRQKTNELIALILSDENALVAYCTIEVKAVLNSQERIDDEKI